MWVYPCQNLFALLVGLKSCQALQLFELPEQWLHLNLGGDHPNDQCVPTFHYTGAVVHELKYAVSRTRLSAKD